MTSKEVLSIREQEVLRLIAHEYSAKEISQQLHISYHTIISHKKNIMTKLKVKNGPGMIRKGYECGILKIENNV